MPPVDTTKTDFVEKVKIRACELRPGMYVCELDRPWLDTPFMLQGFEIGNDADIEAVMQHCEFVYIDMRRTRIIKPRPAPASNLASPHRTKPVFSTKDVEASSSAHKQASHLLKTFADEIRFGHTPKLHLAKAVVSDCVASITANPTTMLLLAKLCNKDEYTSQHAFSVCVYSIIVGRMLGYDSQQLENVGACGLLHDMGKLDIPDEILNKPGKFTPEEYAIMQTHTTLGRDILMSGRDVFSGAVDVAHAHHENLDGTGYPRGLQSHQLNTNCRIVAVVDKYDAMTTHRTYREGYDHLSAVAILNTLAKENKIDAPLKARFISYLGVYPPGSLVELNTGEIAIVIGATPDKRLRPQILVVRDAEKNPVERFVDMSEKMQDQNSTLYRIVTVHRPGEFGIEVSRYFDLIAHAFD